MNFSLYKVWGRQRLLQQRLKLLNDAVSLILAVLYDSPAEAVLALKRAPRALSYLCGLHEPLVVPAVEQTDAHLQRLRDELLRSNLRKLFGEDDGASLFALVASHRDEADSQAGWHQGRVDFERYLENRITPMGLVRMLPVPDRMAA